MTNEVPVPHEGLGDDGRNENARCDLKSPFPMRGWELRQRKRKLPIGSVPVPHEGLGGGIALTLDRALRLSPFPMRGWELRYEDVLRVKRIGPRSP